MSGWRIEVELARAGHYHMSRDEELARTHLPGDASVLRLYSWSPPAVSLGFQQKIDNIDLEACATHRIDVVRRTTGGRAVLHYDELTYAVVTHCEPQESVGDVHNRIVEALARSFEGLGDDAGLALTGCQGPGEFRSNYHGVGPKNVLCFATTTRHELTFEGRKVVGSAQRRFGDVVLQHGSILLNDKHLLLPELLKLREVEREAMGAALRANTATLSDVFGRPITPEEAAFSVERHFVKHICAAQSEEIA